MLTYSEYYNLVKLGLNALQEKLTEASNFTSEQYHKALERENEVQHTLKVEDSVSDEIKEE